MNTSSSPRAVNASGLGAVSGYESRCTCGLVLRSSLLPLLEADRSAHLAWHEKKGA